jgi:hypothetical protein
MVFSAGEDERIFQKGLEDELGLLGS